jgi:hypothetical protein
MRLCGPPRGTAVAADVQMPGAAWAGSDQQRVARATVHLRKIID